MWKCTLQKCDIYFEMDGVLIISHNFFLTKWHNQVGSTNLSWNIKSKF